MSLPAAIGVPRPRAGALARLAWLSLPAIATLALAAEDGGSRNGDWMPWALVAVLAAGGLLAFDVMRLRRGLGLIALGCFGGLALWSGLSVLWAWMPGDATNEASRALFYAAAFAIVLLAVRTQRDAATMVGLIAGATGLVTLYGCLRLAQDPSEAFMVFGRLGWPTGYPNTSASFGVLAFFTLVGVGAERSLLWPLRSLALGAAVPALGFALLTQSRGAAFTMILVAPIAIAVVRERLRLTAFLLVALAGLLPALPALRSTIDLGTAASAGTAAARLLLGGLIVAVLAAVIAVADQRVSISPARRRMLGHGAAIAVAVAAVLLVGVALQQDAPGRLRSAWHSFTLVDADQESGPHLLSAESNRWDFWQVAAGDLAARPLSGFGAGSFGPTYLRDGRSREMPAQAHGQVQELAATLGLPGLLLACSVGAIGLAGLLLRRRAPSTPIAGAAVGTACVLAHAQVDWHWQVPAVALPVVALLACGSALHPLGEPVPRRAVRIGGAVVLALGLLWVLPVFAAERLSERAVARDDPGAARLAGRLSPFDPAPLRVAAQLERRPALGLPDALAAAERAPREWSSWALVAHLAGTDRALVARACARARAEIRAWRRVPEMTPLHALETTPIARDASAPRCFAHDLPDELFTSDALDEICRAAAQRGQLLVQVPDATRERLGQRPEITKPRYPILQDALERPVHYRIFNTATWGPRSHADCRARLQELAGPRPSLGDIPRETVVRVFSPHALVALHGDPDAKLIAGIGGTTVWHVRPVHAMSQQQHENLLRGEFFLPFSEHPEERALVLDPGGACFLPARWAHWLDHPCETASVTFDVGFYTRVDLRDRKVYDVNWLLRKAHLAPAGPGGRGDRAKCLAFDAISTVTRRGLQHRGQV